MLPSSAIEDWPSQKTISLVIEENHKQTKVSKASTLAVKIATEAVFGQFIMKKCTALRGRDLPGLPRAELHKIKKAIYDLFPSYWNNSEDFETTWSNCVDATGQTRKRLWNPTS